MKKLILLSLLSAAVLPACASMTSVEIALCPVCLDDIYYRAQLSDTIFDTGLDLTPVGLGTFPRALPVCKTCGFIAPADSASAGELAEWRRVAASPEYKALEERGAYRNLAFLYERLGAPDRFRIAGAYLTASLEEQGDPAKVKEDLELALPHLEAHLAGLEEGSRGWIIPQYLRAETLRRLSRFREARTALRALRGRDLSGFEALPDLIHYQHALCRRRDPSRRSLAELRYAGLLGKLREWLEWKLMELAS